MLLLISSEYLAYRVTFWPCVHTCISYPQSLLGQLKTLIEGDEDAAKQFAAQNNAKGL